MKITQLTNKTFSGFAQISDIHIGESRTTPNYIERHKDVLWQFLDYCESKKVPAIIPGDLFHRNDTRHSERKLAYDFLSEFETRKIPAVVTAGNHDHIEGTSTQLDALYNLPFKYVKIVTWEPEIVILGNIGIIALSWQDYKSEDIFDLVKNMYPNIANCEYKIVMLHEFVYGSFMDNGKQILSGLKIPKDLPEINYWALGDIHTFQPGNLPNSWFAGSPLQFSFFDKLEKGFIHVSLPFKDRPKFIKTRFKPFLTVNKMEDMTEDAFYHLSGDIDEVVNSQSDNRVLRRNWSKDVQQAVADLNNNNFSVTTGLTEFLAKKGVNEKWQQFAIEYIERITNKGISA